MSKFNKIKLPRRRYMVVKYDIFPFMLVHELGLVEGIAGMKKAKHHMKEAGCYFFGEDVIAILNEAQMNAVTARIDDLKEG